VPEVAKTPLTAQSLFGRGEQFARAQNYLQAIKYFEQAAQMDPYYAQLLNSARFAPIYNSSGIQMTDWATYLGALDDYSRAIALAPVEPSAYVNRGSDLLLLGRNQAALDDLNRALALNFPDPARLYFNRATAHSRLGDLVSAHQDLQKAAQLFDTRHETKARQLALTFAAQLGL